MGKRIRVLQILPSLNVCSGVSNYLINYYKHIDNNKIQFDFIVHREPKESFEQVVTQLGGKVYHIKDFKMSNIRKIFVDLDRFFSTHANEYDIIHCHMANAAAFYFYFAKKHRINIRILHSHQSDAADRWSHRIRNYPLLYIGKKLTTDYFACSKLAGDFLYKTRPYTVVNNAINSEKFVFNMEARQKIRISSGIEDEFVIGHIGRFCNQKNQVFLLDIFKEVLDLNPTSLLMLVGGGEQEELIKNKAKLLGIEEKIMYMGVCRNTEELYQAMDVFCLPSLYEGLPIVGVEAQAAGLPCLVADTVTNELAVTQLISYMSLKKSQKAWANNLISLKNVVRNNMVSEMSQNGFDIQTEALNLQDSYKALFLKNQDY